MQDFGTRTMVCPGISALCRSLWNTQKLCPRVFPWKITGALFQAVTNQSCHCSEGETFAGSRRCSQGREEHMCLRTNSHNWLCLNAILWQNKPVPVRKSRGERSCRNRELHQDKYLHPSPGRLLFLSLCFSSSLCPSFKLSSWAGQGRFYSPPCLRWHLNFLSCDAPGCCRIIKPPEMLKVSKQMEAWKFPCWCLDDL